MTPHQLRVLATVAAAGSVGAAAQALFVTQPAVSAALGSLQRELGVALVRRDGRGLALTEPGAVLAGYARRMLGLLEEARVATVASADPERGQLRLAAVTTAGEHVVPTLLASFRRLHPQTQILLEVGNRRRVWEALGRGEVDLAVGGRPPARANLFSHAVAPNELVVVGKPAGPGERGHDNTAGLALTTWLMREPGSGTRSSAEELLADLQIDPPRLTLGSNGAIRESAIVGLGVALMSRAAVGRELDEGSLEELPADGLPLVRHWHLAAREGDLPATAETFRDHVVGAGWSAASLPATGTARSAATLNRLSVGNQSDPP